MGASRKALGGEARRVGACGAGLQGYPARSSADGRKTGTASRERVGLASLRGRPSRKGERPLQAGPARPAPTSWLGPANPM